ncbi:hypothetical protein [Fusobacterium varium]
MEKNSTFLKSKKIILIDKTNFESSIALILREPDINYLIFLVFKNNIEENLELLKELKRYFFNPAKSEYLSNTIIFTEREYLANDMGVKAIITVKDISNFDINSLNLLYEKYNFSEKNLDNFLIENSAEFSYKIDIYDENDPWITSVNGTGILFISDNTYDKIMCNYHKVKNLYPDITIISLKGKDDSKPLNLLKMIGADAHITLGITSIKHIEYTKRIDALVYNRSPYSESNLKKFIIEILREKSFKNSLFYFRDFLGIPEKNFDADLFYDEEEELNKKEEKYFRLKVTSVTKENNHKTFIEKNCIYLCREKEKNKNEIYHFERIEKID